MHRVQKYIISGNMAAIGDQKLREKVISCKILVVGAGGIGCELLKNLVLTGFSDIEVVDTLNDVKY